ncbi:MAG: hypothetical protein AB7G93_20225 [Bdellovibrionales bacterium]
MSRILAGVTIIGLFVVVTSWADASSLQVRFRDFVNGKLEATHAPQIVSELGQLSEEEVTKAILTEFPVSEMSKPEKRLVAVSFGLAVQQYGNSNFVGYIITALSQLQNGPSDLKPLLLYGFMKAGLSNKKRVEAFLTSYKTTQSDPDTLYAIGVLEEALPSVLQAAALGNPTQIDVQQRISELARMVNTVWYQCPASVWRPKISKEPQALLMDRETRQTWIINKDGLSETGSLPAHLDYEYTFEMSYLGDRPTIAIGLRNTFGKDLLYKGSYSLYLVFHEGFHHMFQSGGWKKESSAQRGNRFPGDFRPRYYRRMAYEHLKRAVLENGRLIHLRKAAFWYRRWKAEFAGETLQVVDRHEGTATYYDVMAVARAHLGCGASKPDVMRFIQANYDMFFETPTGMDNEGYNIGGLAGVLLWFQNRSQWQEKVVRGASPVDLLIGKSAITSDTENRDVLDEVKKQLSEKNGQIASQLHGDLEDFKSDQYVRVTIPRAYENKRMPVANIVIPKNIPTSTIYIVDEGFRSETADGRHVRALGLLPLYVGLSSPCSRFGETFLIHHSQLQQSGDEYSGQNSYVSFRVRGQIRVANGKKWLCSQ